MRANELVFSEPMKERGGMTRRVAPHLTVAIDARHECWIIDFISETG